LIGRTKLDEIYIFEISIKIPFSRVSVTIELGRSLLTVRYHELFERLKASLHLAVSANLHRQSANFISM
jgi:hypothetical protein